MIRQNIATNGEWHVQYKDVTSDQIEAIAQDSETKTLILSSDGYATLEESNNEYKPYLYFKNYNEIGMENSRLKSLTEDFLKVKMRLRFLRRSKAMRT